MRVTTLLNQLIPLGITPSSTKYDLTCPTMLESCRAGQVAWWRSSTYVILQFVISQLNCYFTYLTKLLNNVNGKEIEIFFNRFKKKEKQLIAISRINHTSSKEIEIYWYEKNESLSGFLKILIPYFDLGINRFLDS